VEIEAEKAAAPACGAALAGSGTESLSRRFARRKWRHTMSELVRSDGAGFVAGSLMAVFAVACICLLAISL
jgi:hypothetical protein